MKERKKGELQEEDVQVLYEEVLKDSLPVKLMEICRNCLQYNEKCHKTQSGGTG